MIRNEYKKHIARMFTLYGFKDGEQAAETVLRLETRLATAAKSNVELRDPQANYNKMSVADLQQLVPQIDWLTFLRALNAETDSLSVGQIAHLQEVGKMIEEESLEDLKTLFHWQVLDGASAYLSTEMYNANFDFYGRILSGKEQPSPLWKRAVNMVNGTLGEAVGQMYVKKHFPEENKQRMLDLVHNLQKSLGERIQALEWMSDTTKAKAQKKLCEIFKAKGATIAKNGDVYSITNVTKSVKEDYFRERYEQMRKIASGITLESFASNPYDSSLYNLVNAVYQQWSDIVYFNGVIYTMDSFIRSMEADTTYFIGNIVYMH
jgi:predicted metalloendopeptidase